MGLPACRYYGAPRTFCLILSTAAPVVRAALVTGGLTTAIVLSVTSLAVRQVFSAAGLTFAATSRVAFPTASTAGRTVSTALSNVGWSSFAARSRAAVPASTAFFAAFDASQRSRSISLRGAPHDGQYAASAGNSAAHFGQFISSPISPGAHPTYAFRSPSCESVR